MPNLIYQYYVGDLSSRTRASTANIKAYAQRIGAEYRFDHNPNISARTLTRRYQRRRNHAAYYESLNMLLDDSFLEYDNILFCDCDVFATDDLASSIFAEVEGKDLGICTEPFETKNRAIATTHINSRTDNRWARILQKKWGINLPRDEDGLLKIYNSGVFVFSRQGLLKARERFLPFDTYIHTLWCADALRRIFPPGALPREWGRLHRFYHLDQCYLHAMMLHAKLDYAELPNKWNRCVPSSPPYSVHNEERFAQYGKKYTSPTHPNGIYDMRTKEANLIHIQIAGSTNWDAATLNRITNLPQEEWGV